MKEFKEKLKMQAALFGICALVLAGISGWAAAAEYGLCSFPVPNGDSRFQSWLQGYLGGASLGMTGVLVYCTVRNLLALRSEKKLKALFVRENDERTQQIYCFSRSSAMSLFLLVGTVAVVAAGYFNMIVSLTIFGCIAFAGLCAIGFKFYYSSKF